MNVLAAWIHEDTVSHSFMRSVMAVASRWHSTTGQPLPIGETACSTGDLAFARDQTVIGFLETDLDWLWFVDTDAGFRPEELFTVTTTVGVGGSGAMGGFGGASSTSVGAGGSGGSCPIALILAIKSSRCVFTAIHCDNAT